MIIKSAEFVKGVVEGNKIEETHIPQIVFYGRSNAGKSSIINTVLGRKSLARSSSTPGKTLELNFYLINESFYLVDTPGYGYARADKSDRAKITSLLMWFLDTPVESRKIVLVVDSKAGLTELDRGMLEELIKRGESIMVMVNKVDRHKQSITAAAVNELRSVVPPGTPIIPFSSETKKGIEDFWKVIEE